VLSGGERREWGAAPIDHSGLFCATGHAVQFGTEIVDVRNESVTKRIGAFERRLFPRNPLAPGDQRSRRRGRRRRTRVIAAGRNATGNKGRQQKDSVRLPVSHFRA
jgi:hypothetical protein